MLTPSAGKKSGKSVRTEFYNIFREAIWVILFTLMISAIVFGPAQSREIYRIVIAERGLWGFLQLLTSMLAIAGCVWLAAKLVTTDTLADVPDAHSVCKRSATLLPAALAILPLLGFAFALQQALPDVSGTIAPGAAGAADLLQQRAVLAVERTSLQWFALGGAGVAAIFFACSWLLSTASSAVIARANRAYFSTFRALLISFGLIAAATVIFYFFPVQIANTLGVFGMLAVFIGCVLLATVHLTLLSNEHRWPLIALPLSLAVAFSIFDLNDNHEIRRFEGKSSTSVRPRTPPTAEDEFLNWYEKRPRLAEWSKEHPYPVYVVAAQGGGIFAAYQTAIFLARMQDVCPVFKDHLFAISSVSGGSVGAAIFTAALREVAAGVAPTQPPATAPTPAPTTGSTPTTVAAVAPSASCPAIAAFVANGAPPDPAALKKPGPHETAVRRMLANDLLSPLVGATLFTDFTQRFLPWPIGVLDRARALEASFEAASSPKGAAGTGPLAESYLDHWNPADNRGPALLLNATNTASGRRVVISPFIVRRPGKWQEVGRIEHLPFWRRTETGQDLVAPLDIALSTAAAISARFPWLTPAATVTVIDAKTKARQTDRLVDGGYVDNSGVETALDLIRSLDSVVAKIDDVGGGSSNLRPLKFTLIALSGGDYSRRAWMGLGETLEPVRAMFATREARAYGAVDRAREEMPQPTIGSAETGSSFVPITLSQFRSVKLKSPFYELPLGWSLGSQSRRIIEDQSGWFSNCSFGPGFGQSKPLGSEADCIQLLVFHQLQRSKMDALPISVQAVDYRLTPGQRFDNAAFMACYLGNETATRPAVLPGGETLALRRAQSLALHGLLSIWDEHPQWSDDRWLTLILAYVASETGNFRVKFESMRYSANGLVNVFGTSAKISLEEAEQLTRRPDRDQAIAERIYGEGNPQQAAMLGNTQPGDGWRYRGRGLAQLSGRHNYHRYGRLVGVDLEAAPDLLLDPEIGARVAFAQAFPLGSINTLARYFTADKIDYEGALKSLRGATFGMQDFMAYVGRFEPCVDKHKRK